MNLEKRLLLLKQLGDYLISGDENWQIIKEKAYQENPWFIPEFVNFQLHHIAHNYLGEQALINWVGKYGIEQKTTEPKNVGIVMAGNIPLAGFHDFLSVFVSGHRQTIKPSSRDFQLIKGIVEKLHEWNPETTKLIAFADQLKGCDAYIATGSNNSSRYFDYYFGRFPHIIRRNRTSAAILSGNETREELASLADDVYLYFGLGCRNVTKIYVPKDYDFLPLLESFKKYDWAFDMHKYKNNYDYQLAVMIINKLYYMTNGSILLVESPALFSPIGRLNYEYYEDFDAVNNSLATNNDVQCVVSKIGDVKFGDAQTPALTDYADKADTLQFLLSL